MITHEKPVVLKEGKHNPKDLADLRKKERIWKECDIYADQLKEVFEIENPTLVKTPHFNKKFSDFLAERTKGQTEKLRGNWIYYPWSGLLVHTVSEDEQFALRTNRNKNIITKEEQEILRSFRVGIIGLSVGSNVASALAYGGMANTIKLAEFDSLETTNLNRIRARIDQIGVRKIDVVAQQVYEVNPYADIHYFDNGITKEILEEFVLSDPKPQLIFEIIDSFEMKIHLRSLAREHGIPVVMVTNLGDRLLMDVERYDLDPFTDYFNGRAGSVPEDILNHPDLTDLDKHRYAVKLAGGGKYVPERAIVSVNDIGKTLVGRPQLATTVAISGSVGAYITKRIALGRDLASVSCLIDLDIIFSPTGPFTL